jgi:hypothetical protein
VGSAHRPEDRDARAALGGWGNDAACEGCVRGFGSRPAEVTGEEFLEGTLSLRVAGGIAIGHEVSPG